jgi:hypothetical protein
MLRIYGKLRRYPLRIILVDRLAFIEAEVEFIGNASGTFLRARAACSAFARIHKSGFPVDLNPKISHLAGEFSYLTVRQQINLGMSTDIKQLRRKNSYRAIVSGKGLVQLGHFAADARVLLHQVDLNAHVTQIQGGLHAGYPTAHDENFLRSHINHPCSNTTN